jgi:hypothetical protein
LRSGDNDLTAEGSHHRAPGGEPASLEEFAGPAVERLPTEVDIEHVFTPQNLSVPPEELVTDQVTILKGRHGYDMSEPVSLLMFYGTRQWFRAMGIWILGVVFHAIDREPRRRQGDATITITSLHSEIRSVRLQLIRWPGYLTSPLRYTHRSAKLESRYPLGGIPGTTDLRFSLTDSSGFVPPWDRELQERDVVYISGLDHELLALADLFLNIGIAQFEDWPKGSDFDGEWTLETPQGFGGVSIGSSEPSFLLEGSFAWVRGEVPQQNPANNSLLNDAGRDDRARLNALPEDLRRAAVDELANTKRYPRPEVEAILAKYEDRRHRP